jgi:hypothetical protein
MTSTYLDRPLLPLAVVFPLLLENIEGELLNEHLELGEERRLRWRAAMIRWLLVPRLIT